MTGFADASDALAPVPTAKSWTSNHISQEEVMTITTTDIRPTISSRSRSGALGLASGLVAAALTALFAHDWGEVVFSVSLIALVTAVVFAVVVPRALRKNSAGGTALALAIPAALLALPAFWSGLPLVLGVAGVLVGNHGRQVPDGGRKSIVALVLGALAVVSYIAIYATTGVAGETGFLLD